MLFLQLLQERADKICEMANVMQKSIQIDDDSLAKEQELLARLITENKVWLRLTNPAGFEYALRDWIPRDLQCGIPRE